MSWLLEHARQSRDLPALVSGDETLSWGDLARRVEERRAALAPAAAPGTVVAFDADDGAASLVTLLALVELGAILVPLARRGATDRATALDQAGVELVVDGEHATRRPATAPHRLVEALRASGHPGLVVFSSGSTGTVKAALHDFARLAARYQRPRPPRRVLAFLLLDHLGGIHTVLHALANGGTVVALADRSPDAVCAAIARHRVELLPTSPTFLTMMLMSEAHRRHDLSSLTLVTYGTEPMPATTLARLRTALPGARLLQTYGLTELGVFPTRSRSDDSLWLELGTPWKVVDGELWLKSPMAMLGYLNAPSPFDDDGWFATHDRVLVDGPFLRILGRESEVINVGGEKVDPVEVEAVLLEMDNVRDATVFARGNPVVGQVVAARLVLARPEDAAALRQRVRAFCAPRLPRHKIPVRIEIADRPDLGDRLKKVRRP